MAGITKSPQLRLSPETANVHAGPAFCAWQTKAPATTKGPTLKKEVKGILNMESAYCFVRRMIVNAGLPKAPNRFRGPTYKMSLCVAERRVALSDLPYSGELAP